MEIIEGFENAKSRLSRQSPVVVGQVSASLQEKVEAVFGEGATPELAVMTIINDVSAKGDRAIRHYTSKIDKVKLESLEVDDEISLSDERVKLESGLVSKELAVELHTAINNLPEGYRLLISLRHLQAMSYAEIAEVTGHPLGTVKTGIFRARQILKQRIEAYEQEHG